MSVGRMASGGLYELWCNITAIAVLAHRQFPNFYVTNSKFLCDKIAKKVTNHKKLTGLARNCHIG